MNARPLLSSIGVFFDKMPLALRAACLLTGGISIMGLSDNLVRLVSEDIGLGQYHFLRSAMSIAVFLFLRNFISFSLRPIRLGPVLWRALFLSLSMALFFSVLSFLPVALAGAGLFTSPVFVLLFSVIIFKLRPGWRRSLAVALGSFGVWLILRPDMQAFSLIQLLPVLAGAFYAAASLTTRRYCAQESPYTLSMAYFGMIGLIGFLWALALDLGDVSAAGKVAFLLRGLVWPGPETCFWVAVMTGLSVLGILMITKAYQMAETSYMSIFEYSYLISAGIIGWLLWGNIFRTGEFIGMGLIVAAGLLVALSAARISEQAINEASSKTS